MKAIAKMYRVKPDGSKTPVEAFMSDAATAEVFSGEEVLIQLWHGQCLESEATVRVGDFGAVVTLKTKKELRQDAPKEALC